MVSLTSTTKACLLAAFWSFSWISCLPTPPSKLVENTAFDLNELPRDVEEAESSALHSSTLEPTDRTGSSSTPGHAFATQPHQSAHFRPYWHLSEASTSSSRPLGHSFGWQYADMPTVQYHPVLLQPQWQPTSFAAGPYWPHDQSFNAEHVNQPGAVQMQAFVQQPAPTLGTEHAPAVTFAQPRTWKSSAEPGELSSGGAYGELRAQHSPSVTTSNILVSGPSGNPRDRADTDPLLVRSPETDGNVPLLPVKKLRYEPRKRHDLPKAAASSRAIVAGELAAQNRHYDPKDLRPLSGSYFRFSQRNDPKVTRLINELRLPASADDADGTRANRAYLQRSRFPANPDTFFRTFFWSRKIAKQILLQDDDEARYILVFPLTTAKTISRNRYGSGVAAWEIGRPDPAGSLNMYFYGFHSFSLEDFSRLDTHQAATRKSYYFVAQRPSEANHQDGTKLGIIEADTDDSITPGLGIAPDLQQLPEIRALIESGQLQRAISSSDHISGRHFYVAQQSTVENLAPMRRWLRAAGLPPGTLTPLTLSPRQIENLPLISAARFRRGLAVKIVTEENGEMYMLDFSREVPWLGWNHRGVMVVWKFGPEVGRARRLLINKGFFLIQRHLFDQMNPHTVPGLRDSRFQYSMTNLP